MPNEAQAATGDSGGAAFVGGKLAGLIYAGTAPTSMPVVGSTAFFGDSTYMVQLASYRRLILTVTQLNGFQIPGDFDQNGTVDGGDVIAVGLALTDLTAYKTNEQISDAELLTLGDFDHSGSVTNSDFQRLLDYVSGASGSLTIVPEPAAWVLAGTGA